MEMKGHTMCPRIWYRYVDDMFAICASSKVDASMDLINKRYSSIQFTCERETNNQIPFLHVMVTRNNTKLNLHITQNSNKLRTPNS